MGVESRSPVRCSAVHCVTRGRSQGWLGEQPPVWNPGRLPPASQVSALPLPRACGWGSSRSPQVLAQVSCCYVRERQEIEVQPRRRWTQLSRVNVVLKPRGSPGHTSVSSALVLQEVLSLETGLEGKPSQLLSSTRKKSGGPRLMGRQWRQRITRTNNS